VFRGSRAKKSARFCFMFLRVFHYLQKKKRALSRCWLGGWYFYILLHVGGAAAAAAARVK